MQNILLKMTQCTIHTIICYFNRIQAGEATKN